VLNYRKSLLQLGPLAGSDLELTSETLNLFSQGIGPPKSISLHRTAQTLKQANINRCPQWISNP
jgi:hypothetical protein